MTTKQIFFLMLSFGFISNNIMPMNEGTRVGETQFLDNGEHTILDGDGMENGMEIGYLLNPFVHYNYKGDGIKIIRCYPKDPEDDEGYEDYEDYGTVKKFREMLTEPVVAAVYNTKFSLNSDGEMHLEKASYLINHNPELAKTLLQAIDLNNAAFCPGLRALIYSPNALLARHDLCAGYRIFEAQREQAGT